MVKLIKRLFTSIALLLLLIPSSALIAQARLNNSHPLSAKDAAINKIIPSLEQKIEQAMKAQGIPGVAIAIVSSDKVYYIKTFGVKELGKKDKITPSTLFQIASLSKPINATLMAIMQEKGKLSLEDPIDRFLPHYKFYSQKQPLKICHLMSHSTGIPNAGSNERIQAFIPRQHIIAKLQHARPIASPGKHFAYHNAMYGIVEDIISNVTGKPLYQTLQEELFSPLGMKHACVGMQAMLNSENKAYPHIPNGRGRYVRAPDYSKGYYAFLAAGGVNASLEDLIPFLQIYLGKPTSIVSKQSLQQLTDPFIKNPRAVILSEVKKGVITNTFYGLGWHSMKYSNKNIIYHQGHLKGFRNFMGFLQDDIGIIILTNAEKKHASKFALKFFDLYLHQKT